MHSSEVEEIQAYRRMMGRIIGNGFTPAEAAEILGEIIMQRLRYLVTLEMEAKFEKAGGSLAPQIVKSISDGKSKV